eukprot:5725841-Pyramimonas_sp.AAC.1
MTFLKEQVTAARSKLSQVALLDMILTFELYNDEQAEDAPVGAPYNVVLVGVSGGQGGHARLRDQVMFAELRGAGHGQ